MQKEELYINGERIELIESLNPSLTFNVSDIAKPDTRKADYSKTITLPGSKKLNKQFEHIFEVNLDLQTFNPNLKTEVIYLVDGEINIDGYLQLKQINTLDNDNVTYDCTIVGRLGDFVSDLGNKELDDVGMLWGNLDHDYTLAIQQASWTSLTGYVYPIVDYGFNTGLVDWWVDEMFPSVYAKEYIDRMFTQAGYTYSSSFLTSAPFDKLIIPFGGLDFGLSFNSINNRIFKANTPVFDSTGTDTIDVPNTTAQNPAQNPTNLIRCTNEVYDVGNVYTPATGVFEAPENGNYDFQFLTDLQGEFFGDATNDTYCKTLLAGNLVMIKTDNAGGNVVFLDGLGVQITYDQSVLIPANTTVTTQAVPTYPSEEHLEGSTFNTYNVGGVDLYRADITGGTISTMPKQFNPPNKYVLNATNIQMNTGDKVYIVITLGLYPYITVPIFGGFSNSEHFEDATTPGTYYTGDVNLKMINGVFKNEVVNTVYNEGNTIDMFSAIPKKIKQKDFFMSIVKMFNLYVESDTTNDRNLFIEPRDDFYNNNINDWTQKLDVSKKLEFLPMGALDSQRYLYTYKADKDYYNELYTNTWGDIYGQRIKRINNDFIKNEYKTDVIFSPTPSVGQSYNDKVLPTIKKVDNNGQEVRTQSNIRILYYGGLKDTIYTWTHQSNLVANQVELQYPYAGHYDDPFNPTIDVNFGLTKEIYWDNTFNPITWTNNNLFNIYHSKFIEEITDKNSKIVKGWFYLKAGDIRKLSFREQYYFDGAYFRLYKVENYNPSNPITKCEFLKIKDAETFTASPKIANGGIDDLTPTEQTPKFGNSVSRMSDNNSIGNQRVFVSGTNNYVSRSSQNVEIQGDNNRVQSDTRNVTISGSGNTINTGLENVVLINTNNVEVLASNLTYLNGIIQGVGSVVTITSGLEASEQVTTYLGDTSSGTINVLLPLNPSVGKVWNFKKLSANNIFRITCRFGELIDGLTIWDFTRLNTTYSIQYDGTNYNII